MITKYFSYQENKEKDAGVTINYIEHTHIIGVHVNYVNIPIMSMSCIHVMSHEIIT